MMQDIIIAIPSYSRTDFLATWRTVKQISRRYRSVTRLYVESDQISDYKRCLKSSGVDSVSVVDASRADKPREWGSIMDLIIDECCEECNNLVIMDDDLKLEERIELVTRPTLSKPVDDPSFNKMMNHLRIATTDKYPLTSIQYRQFCHGKTEQYNYNQRVSMVWSLRSRFFVDNSEYRFYRASHLDFMNDYYFFLKLLVDGHQNRCVNLFVKGDIPNASGGISERREDRENFNNAVREFAAMFPDYVTIKEKKNKGSWEDGMLGVIIRAKKAYDDGQNKKAP